MRHGALASRSLGFLVGAAAALVLVVSGIAAACVPQPQLVTVQPRSSGPPGTALTVTGLGFDPGKAEIRWNAGDGQLLASSSGPDFSVPITIPQAHEGLYHLIVLSRSPGGEIGNTRALAFQVTRGGAVPAASASPPSAREGRPVASSTSSTRVIDLLLTAGVSALVAAGCAVGFGVVRLRRASTDVTAIEQYDT